MVRLRQICCLLWSPGPAILLLGSAVASVCGWLSGCAGTGGTEAGLIGGTAVYVPGLPNFEAEAIGQWKAEEPGIELYLNAITKSLTFVRSGSGFGAFYEVSVTLRDRETRNIVAERTWVDTTWYAQYASTQRTDQILESRWLRTVPGDYLLIVQVEDRNTGKSFRRSLRVVVPDIADRRPSIGRILLQSRHPNGPFHPVVEFYLPMNIDSLRADVYLYNIPDSAQQQVTVSMVKFRTDTLPASPPYAMSYASQWVPLGFGTMSLDKVDTLRCDTVSVRTDTSGSSASYVFPSLPKGIYMLTMRALVPHTGSRPGDTVLVTHRFFSLQGPGFPRPTTLNELAEEMVYILTDKEMKYLQTSSSEQEKRHRFDSLWLSFVHDPTAAASLIKRYYSRVEEANEYFTSVKEGWKTDRGMMYIMLGPPVGTDMQMDVQNWYYDFPGTYAVNMYSFKRIIVPGPGISVEAYILLRNGVYETFWEDMVGRWRSGQVF